MRRFVSTLTFALGFVGAIALLSPWSAPAASTDRTADAYGARLAPGGAQPYVVTSAAIAAARSALYLMNARAYPDALPTNPPHTSFGKLMPDGTYCGVGCRSTDIVH